MLCCVHVNRLLLERLGTTLRRVLLEQSHRKAAHKAMANIAVYECGRTLETHIVAAEADIDRYMGAMLTAYQRYGDIFTEVARLREASRSS